MNSKTQMKVMAVAVASAFGAPLHAADGAVFFGEVTPKLYSFDYFKGSGTNATQFLERYNYQQGMGGNQRDGNYLDLDLNVVGKNAQRTVFELEREGFGASNHRGTVKANSDTLGFSGYYTNFRTATHGLNFLYSPGAGVPGGIDPAYAGNANTGYLSQFNNDSAGQTSFMVDRTTYGLGLALKPTLFNAAAAVNYDGYKRDGNRFATWILGNGDVNSAGATGARVLERWRGVDKPIDEKMNRYTFNLTGAPGGFVLSYEGALEKFDNKSKTFTVNDFRTNIETLAGGVASGAVVEPGIYTRSVHFVPDATLISNNFRFAKNYGSTAVAAGYGLSVLDQDSFSQEQQAASYNRGKITTNSAYLNVTSNVFSSVGLEGFAKYNNRKNDSSFPAVGLLDPAHGEQLTVRINWLRTLSYGLAATFRPTALKSTVTVGWKRQDKDRDLTWSSATVSSVQPHESLYKEKTRADELYVNWNARPMPGMILRVTPAYVTASQTGLVSEPEEAFTLKTKLSYAAKNGMLASGYYNYKNYKNANNAFTDSTVGGAPAAITTRQDNNKTQQSAGVSLNFPVSEWINTTASLSWLQGDFASNFLRSNRRRYEGTQNVLFADAGRSNYNVDSHILTLGGDWQVSDNLRWNGNYTWSKSKGNIASGYIFDQLSANNTIDGTINSALHSLALGVDYAVKKNIKLKASYVYEYNKDASYPALTGGYHALMMGVGVGF
ncbi:MtrB/PioB family outer membrane beta-barrel protein [Rhodoferax sp.]|uniref:MtrB/PioB family outer membrane beta-barrel protein n=1 Tax=Rhodoferax sp. TaxID=50421 RepID=UPI002753807A|nr:hypothetical protein [Rhodoferax sp.]